MSQHEPQAARRQPFQRATGLAAVMAAAVLVAWGVLPGVTQNALAATTLTFTAVADAQVKSTSANQNFGLQTTLQTRAGSPEYRTYLRFTVAGLIGPASGARLRLFVTDASPNGGKVADIPGRWTESMLTWATAPPLGTPLGTFANASAGSWIDITLQPGSFVADGSYSMAVTNNGTNSAIYSSREGLNPPQLSS